MPYQPLEKDLVALGFRTEHPGQPYPTRAYTLFLANGNVLYLTPRPGMQSATEFTVKRIPVARHSIDSLNDLMESVSGRGRRQLLAVK